MGKYVAFVREEYIRHVELYNHHGVPDDDESGWRCAVLPLYLGIYIEDSYHEVITAAANDHGIVPEAILAIEV